MLKQFFKLLINISELIINAYHTPKPFYSNDEFLFTYILEKNYKKVIKEVKNVLGDFKDFDKISKEQSKLPNYQGAWKTLIFKVGRTYIEKNMQKCPETYNLLEKIPNLKFAMVSLLEPGSKLIPHHGTYGGLLRVHLGLKIPKGEVFISVDGVKKKWQEGKVLIFDDKFLHYAENNTDQTRIVLFLDILKPLPWAIQLYNRIILYLIETSPFIKRMVENS
jgi:beta-hydroxylase